jgi:5'-phosphate synthase pdxT subunit
MDIAVRRNAFGRQVDSFEAELAVPVLGGPPFHTVFIRAPLIERVGKGAEVLARLENETIVAVRQGNLLATAFHPELTDDDRFHRYFLDVGSVQQAE